MSKEIIQREGRRLLVEFTCGRCGAIAYSPYEHSVHSNVSDNMRHTTEPPGWKIALGYMPLMCDKCIAEHKAFMEAADERI